jgi:hypothetical protein
MSGEDRPAVSGGPAGALSPWFGLPVGLLGRLRARECGGNGPGRATSTGGPRGRAGVMAGARGGLGVEGVVRPRPAGLPAVPGGGRRTPPAGGYLGKEETAGGRLGEAHVGAAASAVTAGGRARWAWRRCPAAGGGRLRRGGILGKKEAARVRPGPRSHYSPCESFTHEPGRLLPWRSSAPQPVPHPEVTRMTVNKWCFFFAQIPRRGCGGGARPRSAAHAGCAALPSSHRILS